jgi:L-threonylcarbamoyladenylate synthase
MGPKKTERLFLHANELWSADAQNALSRAASILRAGGTVAFPTETVYGLGANALDTGAVEKIFIAKQRPAWDPLIVHICDVAMLDAVVSGVSSRACNLIDAFWPGPLTLLLPRSDAMPLIVTAGRTLVGVRMPAHPVAAKLIAAAGLPLAAPSANRFGHTSPTTAQHVLDDLDGRIDAVLDAGATPCGVESTVVEVTEDSAIVYRPGAIAIEEIEAVVGPVALYQPSNALQDPANAPPESLPSPGVGIRHYAPKAQLRLVEVKDSPTRNAPEKWLQMVRELCANGSRVGVMLPDGWPTPPDFNGVRFAWGDWGDDRMLARRLFAGLRELDASSADVILCPLPLPRGLGAAIRDRLLKAAKPRVGTE